MHAATDVTGFGLLGHLRNVTKASGCSATIWLEEVPVLDAARSYVRDGVVPGGTHANSRFLKESVTVEGLSEEEVAASLRRADERWRPAHCRANTMTSKLCVRRSTKRAVLAPP